MLTDIHTHILPNVDDGAHDMKTALKMLRIAQEDGTKHIIVTPHYINGSYENNCALVTEKCKELSEKAVSEDIHISIYPGAEAFIFPNLPEFVRGGVIPTLNGSSYVLVELPMMSIPQYTDEVLYNLQLYGYTPIIAHPERNNEIIKDPNRLYTFITRGALAQVNKTSLTRIYGGMIYKTAETLLRHNLVHFVASDAHTCSGRSPKLTKAYNIVSSILDVKMADRLFKKNGQAAIDNTAIEKNEPEKVSDRRFWQIKL